MRLRGSGRTAAALVVSAALALALVPPPPALLGIYADRVYPALQASLTPLSNRTTLPIFDLTWMLSGLALVAYWVRLARQASRSRGRRLRLLGRGLAITTLVASAFYVWFVAVWGWHYRRPGVEAVLAGFRRDAATPAAVRALAERAVREASDLHAPAHAHGFPEPDAVPAALLASFHRVEAALGRPRPLVPSRPKRPLTAPYMRAVGVSGMLAPLYLETYLSPDLTGPERPSVLAHEWAHLAGFALEEDASFVGLWASLEADVASRYSAWLLLVMEALTRLQPVTRELVWPALAEGPRRDLEAIAARQAGRIRWLDRASWRVYDRAIRSQGAESGAAGYGRVVELVLGSGLLDRGPVTP